MPRISIIAALGKNRELGCQNALLWRIPDDLKRFKSLTLNHPVIMGRKTFESIGKPLPGRANIVVSRDPKYQHEGALIAGSLEEALNRAATLDSEEVFIIGGAQIYEQALTRANRLYMTLIDEEKPADAFFPPYEEVFTKVVSEESGEHEGLKYHWITLER